MCWGYAQQQLGSQGLTGEEIQDGGYGAILNLTSNTFAWDELSFVDPAPFPKEYTNWLFLAFYTGSIRWHDSDRFEICSLLTEQVTVLYPDSF